MSVKISQLEIENAKRVKSVAFSPAGIGLTLIGGNNCQGKTSMIVFKLEKAKELEK